ncbi:type A chloramphenicol O-acetyltransferase [Escherichia coli]|nr:type A chloramphenicol O-acetyltransferase [Escherichia coli]
MFAEAAYLMRNDPNRSYSKLVDTLLSIKIEKLRTYLRNSPAANLVEEKIEKTAISIRAVLTNYVKAIRYLQGIEHNGEPFTIRDWMRGVREDQKNGWLFISSNADTHASLKPVISMWLSIAIRGLLAMGENRNRRVWFFCDELPTLHKLPDLVEILPEARKFGGCYVFGIQSYAQLEDIYGEKAAATLFDVMEKKITGYTTVDISQWHRKEHFEAFQSVAQCTYNQTVQLDITAFLKTVKKNKHKFYPAFIHILARLMNAHPEFRMAMKDGELVIWDSVHPCYTVFHEQTETFSSLWSEYHDDFRQFLHIYSQDVACYGENLAYFPKGFIENMFFVSANPWVSFTSFDLNVANMDNFFAPVFTMGKYYTQGDKVLMPLAIQVHHAVCDGFHVGRMLNELQQYCDEWQGGA